MTDDPRTQRKRPVHGVIPAIGHPTIVFVTVCTKDRTRWLASPDVHSLLRSIWEEPSPWLVGRYILMPDHVHLFAGLSAKEVPLESWVKYWKTQYRKRTSDLAHEWQDGHWDRRLRNEESYESKWEYVRSNPVRHGLVASAEDWPYQGTIHDLSW